MQRACPVLQESMCVQEVQPVRAANEQGSGKEAINSLIRDVHLQLFTVFLRLPFGIFS